MSITLTFGTWMVPLAYTLFFVGLTWLSSFKKKGDPEPTPAPFIGALGFLFCIASWLTYLPIWFFSK